MKAWVSVILFALSAVAGQAGAQIIDFEIPATTEGSTGCSYSGTAPTICNMNLDTDVYDAPGALNTAALSIDGERVCGKADSPAYAGDCYISLLRNSGAALPAGAWTGVHTSGYGMDQQGQLFNVSAIGTGPRSLTVYSRANPQPRYMNYAGVDGYIQIYVRDTTVGTTGWYEIATQRCVNTTTWAACTVAFTVPATAQQMLFQLSPTPPAGGSNAAGSVDFDAVNISGLMPPAARGVAAVPTLDGWAMLALLIILAYLGIRFRRV